jgi:hypothetical protein
LAETKGLLELVFQPLNFVVQLCDSSQVIIGLGNIEPAEPPPVVGGTA